MCNQTRICSRCKIEKSITEYVKDKYDKTGYTYQCKICRRGMQKKWVEANPEKVKILNAKHKENRKEYYASPERKLKYRKKFIEKKFGILYEEYERMQNEQNNLCAICHNPETSLKCDYLSVDHCHSTGKIRALLCTRCNLGLGSFKDDIIILKNASNYLKKYK